MSTQALERLVADALRAGDTRPVDLPGARAEIARRVEGHRHVHRQVLALVAAVVALVVSITVPLALSGRGERPTPPVGPAPTKLQLSPSGLPVGVLEGKVDRSAAGVTSTVRLLVRPDGTGTWNAGTRGEDEGEDGGGDSVADYDVDFVTAGRGRAVMRNRSEAPCFATDALTLHFSVRERTVRITDVSQFMGCLASRGLAKDMPGTTLRIRPLPLELSPSGLPVGLLEGKVKRTGRPIEFATLRLWVRKDGTANLGHVVSMGGSGDATGSYPVSPRRLGPGRVALGYTGEVCSDPRALTLDFVVRGRELVIEGAQASGCLVVPGLLADLPGTTLRILPLPASGQIG